MHFDGILFDPKMGTWYCSCMRIIAKRTLRDFWEQSIYVDSEQPLKSWFKEASKACWRTPTDIKDKYRHASFPGNNRVVFNIAGNKYRLIVRVNYNNGMVYVRFVGTHTQYDQIDVRIV